MKRAFLLLFLALTLSFFCITKIDNFTPEILLEVATQENGDSFDFSPLNDMVAEPLHFIGNGLEAVAFVTSDEQYVLKFILKRQTLKKFFLKPKKKWKQLFYNINEIHSGNETLKKYEWANQYLRDETGVLAVHSGKSNGALPICSVIDYRGKKHFIDLNKVAFIVQKKAKIISRHMSKAEFETVNLELKALFSNIASKGFVSKSHTFNPINFAMLDGKALMIDVGKLDFAPETDLSEVEKAKLNARYNSWLKRKLDLF